MYATSTPYSLRLMNDHKGGFLAARYWILGGTTTKHRPRVKKHAVSTAKHSTPVRYSPIRLSMRDPVTDVHTPSLTGVSKSSVVFWR